MDNAIDAISGKTGAKIEVLLLSEPGGVTFEIRDNGPGISQMPIEKCLEKGVSTKGPDRGFGLYNVNERLKRAGGDLRLENQDGLVCTVWIPEAI